MCFQSLKYVMENILQLGDFKKNEDFV
jgi:hypothetical protein